MPKINPARLEKITKAVANRQPDLTIVLENVHDTHNIGAVMRSADSIGLREIYVLNTDPKLAKAKMKLGKRTSSGARKWLDIHYYRDIEACFAALSEKYEQLLAANLAEQSHSLYALDLTKSTALIFGNEHAGITPDTLSRCTGSFIIPQVGLTQSLNISVACAITLFEALRQRQVAGLYPHPQSTAAEQETLLQDYLQRHTDRYKARVVFAKDDSDQSED